MKQETEKRDYEARNSKKGLWSKNLKIGIMKQETENTHYFMGVYYTSGGHEGGRR